MLQGVIDKYPALRLFQATRQPSRSMLVTALCMLLALVVTAAWAHSCTAVPTLGPPNFLQSSGLYADWSNGSVIVVLRHAERCDRSGGACLGDPTGITVAGSQVAADVGRGLQRLGLEKTDVWASPEVRTQQTAHALFGKTIATQNWLNQCDDQFAKNAFALKRSGHNLLLVSHSGCMEQLELALEVPSSAISNNYASALFITLGSDGKAKLLGQMAASEWHTLVAAKEL
ncbi:histidine phosphatase family protein [Pseudomonas sp. Leaf58]|uniref:lipopolysaccharide core heptose(II)-phosphate phosphatase PmrG n=1 Tax=Pseudomonas sp. Leaf58 TaxID=1736226 RepID=UPI0007002AE2|nr:phosphohistidine phosphatase [Pseudomonas sp. Leaf58]AYG44973.1 histidine phosphatase family protein [Pseudomonas sp. Leaf58]KQN65114.1 phosphohistidine phosphatase [Pseudomonas sp. Leaf58]